MFRECFPTATTRTVGKEISLYTPLLLYLCKQTRKFSRKCTSAHSILGYINRILIMYVSCSDFTRFVESVLLKKHLKIMRMSCCCGQSLVGQSVVADELKNYQLIVTKHNKYDVAESADARVSAFFSLDRLSAAPTPLVIQGFSKRLVQFVSAIAK